MLALFMCLLTLTCTEWCFTGQPKVSVTSVQTLGSLLGSWVDRRKHLDLH